MTENQSKLTSSRGLRPHIGLLGPCNSGKSSLMNGLTGTSSALVSAESGTTTDPVFRNMELLPYGPVCFVDTAGLDDQSNLGELRIKRALEALGQCDVLLLVSRANHPEDFDILYQYKDHIKKGQNFFFVFSHKDLLAPAEQACFLQEPGLQKIKARFPDLLIQEKHCFLINTALASDYENLREALARQLEKPNLAQKKLLADLVKPCKLVLMIVPLDLEAPAGRLILPQVQAIREVLDSDAACLVVKERELDWALKLLKQPPDLAICDSQVVLKAAASIPETVPLTTFSILFSRQKGDLERFVKALETLDTLKDGDKVLIAESCVHRSSCDDIGRVKIPRWIRQYTGRNLEITTVGGEFPQDLEDYKLIVHCGACMISPKMMQYRMALASDQNLPITNYGLLISKVQGVLERVIRPLGF